MHSDLTLVNEYFLGFRYSITQTSWDYIFICFYFKAHWQIWNLQQDYRRVVLICRANRQGTSLESNTLDDTEE